MHPSLKQWVYLMGRN